MKIEAKKQTFQPIAITLETQEEVDAMWAVFNHGWISEGIGRFVDVGEQLERHTSSAGRGYFNTLDAYLKSKAKIVAAKVTSLSARTSATAR